MEVPVFDGAGVKVLVAVGVSVGVAVEVWVSVAFGETKGAPQPVRRRAAATKNGNNCFIMVSPEPCMCIDRKIN